jgi:hypothetical protein
MGGGFGVERKNVKGGRYDGRAAPRSSGVGPGWCQGAGRRKTRREDQPVSLLLPQESGSQSARAAARSPAPLILIADDGKHDTRLSSLNAFSTALSKTNFIKQY